MAIFQIQSDVEAIEKNATLYEETNFDDRVEAIDFLDFHVIARIEGLLHMLSSTSELNSLKQRAESVKGQLEAVDANLFQRLRARIRAGGCTGTAFRSLIHQYVGRNSSGSRQQDEAGYDNLDLFVNGLFSTQAVPVETKAREPGMVYYQKTPARIIFELVERAHFTEEDVFYDLGAGLGQVPILVKLLSGATAKGIEFEPAYCAYASNCAADLHLPRVAFIQADARAADYPDGSVFFMYTPFVGSILQEVLEILRSVSQKRKIRLFTYGPCTPQVARQSWLKCADRDESHLYKLALFRSL